MGNRRARSLRLTTSHRAVRRPSTSRSRARGGGLQTFVLAELKARCDDLAAVRRYLRGRARHERTLRQIDTYFVVPRGRLKLREARGGGQLIFYRRPDRAAAKRSDVAVVPVRDGGTVVAVLGRALGVRAVVTKVRESWRWRGVQVQLDTVDGLGTFVELKKVVRGARALAAASRELTALRRELGLAAADIQAPSYSELVGRRRASATSRREPRAPPMTAV